MAIMMSKQVIALGVALFFLAGSSPARADSPQEYASQDDVAELMDYSQALRWTDNPTKASALESSIGAVYTSKRNQDGSCGRIKASQYRVPIPNTATRLEPMGSPRVELVAKHRLKKKASVWRLVYSDSSENSMRVSVTDSMAVLAKPAEQEHAEFAQKNPQLWDTTKYCEVYVVHGVVHRRLTVVTSRQKANDQSYVIVDIEDHFAGAKMRTKDMFGLYIVEYLQ